MKPLSPAAIDVLSSVEVAGKHVRLTAQLDRKLYVEVNAALEALGGKWNRKAKAHVFEVDPVDAIDQVTVDGAFTDKRRDLDQFYTPPELAKRVVATANVAGCSVLEPSAGRGALVVEALRQGAREVEAFERDRDSCEALMLRGAEAASPTTQLVATVGDFLNPFPWDRTFERVTMNPPFSLQRDIAHVTKAYSLLAPGGLLVAIMSAGVDFRSDRRTMEFRKLLASAHGDIDALPEHSFRESGTDVNAVLVTMRRP